VSTLYTFTGQNGDGASPDGGVVGGNRALYGTTEFGGGSTACLSSGCGAIFALEPPAAPGGAWTESILYNFAGGPTDGAYPNAVAMGKDGVLYGTTSNGGLENDGVVFALEPPASPGGSWTRLCNMTCRVPRLVEGEN